MDQRFFMGIDPGQGESKSGVVFYRPGMEIIAVLPDGYDQAKWEIYEGELRPVIMSSTGDKPPLYWTGKAWAEVPYSLHEVDFTKLIAAIRGHLPRCSDICDHLPL